MVGVSVNVGSGACVKVVTGVFVTMRVGVLPANVPVGGIVADAGTAVGERVRVSVAVEVNDAVGKTVALDVGATGVLGTHATSASRTIIKNNFFIDSPFLLYPRSFNTQYVQDVIDNNV